MKNKIYTHLGMMILILITGCQSALEERDVIMHDEPVLISDSDTDASCVYLTDTEEGIPVISWVAVDSLSGKTLYLAYWDEESDSFSNPESITLPDQTSVHEEGMPKVAVKGDGRRMIFYEVSQPSPHSRWGVSDIHFVVSAERGGSWSEPRSVMPDKPENSSISFSGVTRLEDGEIGIGWLGTDPDPDATGRPVYFARTFGGDKFGEPVLVDPSACECCRVAVSAQEGGSIALAYRDLLPGSVRDVSVVISHDGGKSFADPVPFSGDQWQVEGCPHNGPSIVSVKDKFWVSWFTIGDHPGVYLAELDDSGEVIQKHLLSSSAQFVQTSALTSGEVVAAYDETYSSEEDSYRRISVSFSSASDRVSQEITPPGVKAAYPVLQPTGENEVVVAWKEEGKIYYSLRTF